MPPWMVIIFSIVYCCRYVMLYMMRAKQDSTFLASKIAGIVINAFFSVTTVPVLYPFLPVIAEMEFYFIFSFMTSTALLSWVSSPLS